MEVRVGGGGGEGEKVSVVLVEGGLGLDWGGEGLHRAGGCCKGRR